MFKKIAINVFFNVGLILSVMGIGWSVKNDQWFVLIFCGTTFVTFLWFKMQFMKKLRNELRK